MGTLCDNGGDFRLRTGCPPTPSSSPRAPEWPSPPIDPAGETGELTLAQVAARAGVSPATVKRWVDGGLIPGYDGSWTPAAAAYARVVARLRARGHTLAQIKRAGENGQLAVGPLENLLSSPGPRHSLRQAVRISGLDGELIKRTYADHGAGRTAPGRVLRRRPARCSNTPPRCSTPGCRCPRSCS